VVSYKHDHTHLTSTDPRKAVEFYTRVLGARVIGEITSSGERMVDLDIGGLPVRISGTTGVEKSRKGQPPVAGEEAPRFGLHHFALLVDNLDETAADLKSKGVEFIVEPAEARPGLRYAFIKAPDNVRIELIEKSESH
jgi:catechol 2,3-dioxygenase-like lactoylglutathione lyase family enzyme